MDKFGLFVSCASNCFLFNIKYHSKVYLLKANRQNILELSIVDHAKSMIYRNNRIKLCHTKEELIKEKDETIMNTRVHFQDYSTYMECTYDNVCMKIYYDDKSIVDVVIDEP